MTMKPVYPGSGSGGDFPNDGSRSGTYIYDDLTHDSADFNVPGTGAFVKLPNDAAGGLTQKFVVNGITEVWDSVNQEFNFSETKFGDIMEIRLDLQAVTTSPNQSVLIRFEGGIGSPSPFDLSFIDASYKDTGVHEINRYTSVFLIDANSRDFPAELQIASDAPLAVRNIRFFVHAVTRGL